MKTRLKLKQVKPRFGPEERFEINPVVPPAPFRGVVESELDQLKSRLLRELINQGADTALHVRLRRAANDAASIAWMTPFPLLFFPTLLDEKVSAAKRQQARQRRIRQQTQTLLDEAATVTAA
jgi:hypothetical protein